MTDPKEIVREGYDKLSSDYRIHFAASHEASYEPWLNSFVQYLKADDKILELGCGDGLPVARFLSQRHRYLGVEISPAQVALARANVPEGTFEVADMTKLFLQTGEFAGIVALYSLIHVPIEQQPALIEAMYIWLQAGGCVLAIVGAKAWTGIEKDWIVAGTTMYWSHADSNTYIKWFSSAGFTIEETKYIPEGDSGHTLIIARKT
ncbi:class I SAM-dependent methyltransferase [uncultured Imperialibacter sp.]|uniref:class I SAM-dependent methyltransferase n=1 Tax=uncultured Imperialibacter sp. TaxID=1672639 RepID=UPI0030DCCF8A|tara:strand:- start:11384 stop:12001 length:618 start_codon:yes stop_codon:yes gene_type:complete